MRVASSAKSVTTKTSGASMTAQAIRIVISAAVLRPTPSRRSTARKAGQVA
jgi:hypothetical protein